MNWFKRRNKKKEEIQTAEEIISLVKIIWKALPENKDDGFDSQIHISAFRIPSEKIEVYAKRLDKLLNMRGEAGSGGGSSWIIWKKGLVNVTLFK